MSYSPSMSDEQIIKFNKYVAKHTKKVMMEKVIDVERHRMKLKVRVSTVIGPKDKWGYFRVNVKVLETNVKTVVRDEYGFMERDMVNGRLVYEYVPRSLRRSEVNSSNYEIRKQVENRVSSMLDFFGVDSWRVKVEKVAHS